MHCQDKCIRHMPPKISYILLILHTFIYRNKYAYFAVLSGDIYMNRSIYIFMMEINCL